MLLFNKMNRVLVLVLIIAIFSCNNNQLNNTSNSNIEASNTGSVKMIIPSLLSNLGIEFPETTNSRAIISADYIETTVYKNGQILETYKDYNLFSNGLDFSTRIILTPGTYTLKVNIYNINNSIDEPVLFAESEEFNVVKDDTTHVFLTAKPVKSLVLEKDGSVLYNQTDKKRFKIYYDWYKEENTLVSGVETWLSFTANSEYTEIYIDKSLRNSNIVVKLFTPEDSYLIAESSIVKTVQNTEYYIGVIGLDYSNYYNWSNPINPSNIDSFNIGFREITIDPDNNNSIETAKVLTVNEVTECEYNGIDDIDYFSIALEAQVQYKVTIEGNKTPFSGLILRSKHDIDHFSKTGVYSDILIPNEDKTVYVQLNYGDFFEHEGSNLKIKFQKLKDLPVILDSFLSYTIPNTINHADVRTLDYIIKDTTDNSVIYNKSFTIDEKNYYNYPSAIFENLGDRSNLIAMGIAKDSSGTVIALGYDSLVDKYIHSNNVYHEYDDYYYLQLSNVLTYINTPNIDYITVGKEMIFDINISYNDALPLYFSTTEPSIRVFVKESPIESQLLNNDLSLISSNESSNYDYSGSINFTPDISGHYILEVVAKYGDLETTKEIKITALKSGEGELDVTFE